MQLTPIENSSNVKAVGWEAGTLCVVFHDGARYQAPCTLEQFGALMASPSKGSFIHQNFTGKMTRSDWDAEGAANQAAANLGPTPNYAVERVHLSSYDHDPCCGASIQKALLSGELNKADWWACPKCGETWRPTLVQSEAAITRHWTMRPYIEVLKLRG
jgi:KTSC domain